MDDDATAPSRDPFDLLSEAFDRDEDRTRPLTERTPVTAALEDLLGDAIALLRPDTFIEVGAFEADFSRRMKVMYPDARVVAFEANPRVHAAFAAEVEAAGVDYRQAAVGETNGTARFFIPTTIAGAAMPFVGRMGSLHEVGLRDSTTAEVETVMTTLDDAVGAVGDRKVCLWIDVEGAVDKVLAGAAQTLASATIVYCELESRPVWRNQTLAASIREQLAQAGFVSIARDCQKWFQFNALFVRPGDRERLAARVETYVATALALYRRSPGQRETVSPMPDGA